MNNFTSYCRTLVQIAKLPVAQLCFQAAIDPDDVSSTYRNFTRRHPRYKIIRHKTVGAALLDLNALDSLQKYLDQIKGKNGGAYHAKRARSRGYRFTEIDRNRHVDEIHEINTSVDQRQGRPMDQHYTEKKLHFEALKHYKYYGILNPDGRLMAYANVGMYGNFCAFSQLIGHRNNDGIMHLLVVEIVSQHIGLGNARYIMYDTFFGAQPGLRQFKTILGFRPYLAKYRLQ